jgi:hypothetical protein
MVERGFIGPHHGNVVMVPASAHPHEVVVHPIGDPQPESIDVEGDYLAHLRRREGDVIGPLRAEAAVGRLLAAPICGPVQFDLVPVWILNPERTVALINFMALPVETRRQLLKRDTPHFQAEVVDTGPGVQLENMLAHAVTEVNDAVGGWPCWNQTHHLAVEALVGGDVGGA